MSADGEEWQGPCLSAQMPGSKGLAVDDLQRLEWLFAISMTRLRVQEAKRKMEKIWFC